MNMATPTNAREALVLENRHTGERLELRRIVRNSETWLEARGTLPPHGQGPPLHLHIKEAEEFHVKSGTLSAEVDGRPLTVGAGEIATIPRGSPHRWWNDGDDTLVVDGYAKPVVDLDRFLQATFDVLNKSHADRPSLFYMAHLAWRHRHTQTVLFMPRAAQAIVLPLILFVGTILGRYRGTDWPGAPERCRDVPLCADDTP
jgi:quercetin dioxygenase-like cupin family protein